VTDPNLAAPGGEKSPQHSDAEREELLRQCGKLLDLSREAILVVDREEKIIFWSTGAERLYGWTSAQALGAAPLELLKTDLPRPFAQIQNILQNEEHWDCELRQSGKAGDRLTVATRWARWRDEFGQVLGRFQLDTDITRRKQAEEELRILSGHLLTLRDEERRRLARDLHDSVGQLLAGATMNVSILSSQSPAKDPKTASLFAEISKLLEQSVKEIRTISYLLHPPLLDEIGLLSALRWYVAGFAERSQIKVELEIPEDLGRFRRELELAVFRIVQETLTNVHRHSGSESAKITLTRNARQLRMKVEDKGHGMASPLNIEGGKRRNAPGVGISGIRERVRQLGGQMQIRSGVTGTVVEILFPVEDGVLSSLGALNG
jgi:PAS domain S-box-containing protein